MDRIAFRALDHATRFFIAFDASAYTPDPSKTIVIPHAIFTERYLGYPSFDQVPGRILICSAGPLPQAAANLVRVPQVMDTEGVSIRLSGQFTVELESPRDA